MCVCVCECKWLLPLSLLLFCAGRRFRSCARGVRQGRDEDCLRDSWLRGPRDLEEPGIRLRSGRHLVGKIINDGLTLRHTPQAADLQGGSSE